MSASERPDFTEDSVAGFGAQVALASSDRARSWDAVADVLTAPDEELTERLRAGELTDAWRAGARWLGADADLFHADLLKMDVYARGAVRRQVVGDLAALRRDHEALVGADAALADHARDLAELCRQEAQAWAAGDFADGKALRVRERDLIAEHLEPVLPTLGGRLANEGSTGVVRTIGRLVLAVLSVESGKDYQRAVLGDNRSASTGGSADPNGF
ncbi:MAG: hypothetical protein ACYC1Z_13335 [Georgenia sp.]